jgi:YVTN family beta-propeller protein
MRAGAPLEVLLLGVASLLPACSTRSSSASPPVVVPRATHSGPMVLSPDGSRLYVVHPDADEVSVIDTGSESLVLEIPMAATPPAMDASAGMMGHYTPSVSPRAIAIDDAGKTLYVTGQRSGHLYTFDAASGTKTGDTVACAEPIGVLLDAKAESVYVACSQDDMILQFGAPTLGKVASVPSAHKPWALAWAADGTTLLATHLLGWSPLPATANTSSPGVSAFKTSPLAFDATWQIEDGPPAVVDGGGPDSGAGTNPVVPHGVVRGVYDAVVRPGTTDLWTVHLMLGIDTAQPDLDFLETVFPAVTILSADGSQSARLTVSTSPGDGAAFGDIVSGPRALNFSSDGRYAFIVDTGSEDILVVDANAQVEAALVRPLPGHMPEGAVWGPGNKLYVQERNTEDVAVLDVVEAEGAVTVTVETTVIGAISHDPMPQNLRLGQHLFYSANSDEYPITSNHWVSCSSCHLEGHSDAVTWKFSEGPRDTPSNGGGTLDTGFLFRSADRNKVQDYWQTIDVEQGGNFSLDASTQVPLLNAIADYVNYAIPIPVPPTQDPSAVAAGEAVWNAAGCTFCHAGEARTDSGRGNPTLDLAGPVVSTETAGGVLLHDVGTCVTEPFPDVSHKSIDGNPRPSCSFDTPSLRGLWDSAPYFHDGSATTL